MLHAPIDGMAQQQLLEVLFREMYLECTDEQADYGPSADVLIRLDEITPNKLPRRTAINASGGKRKGNFDTTAPRKVSRPETNGGPGTFDASSRGDVQEGFKYGPRY